LSQYVQTLRHLLPYTHIHPPLQLRISNLLSAVSLHPLLHSTITGRVLRSFPEVARAHRLLSGPYNLPSSDRCSPLAQPPAREDSDKRFGLSGGKGGIETWAELAGEEPSLAEGEEGWYARPENIEGVFNLCLRHRVRARGDKGEVMWLLSGSAVDPPSSRSKREKATRRDVERIMDDILLNV
jgi:hypothetical protein